MAQVWLIRNDVFDEELVRDGFISIGWDEIGDLAQTALDTASLVGELQRTHGESSRGSLLAWAGTLRRFYEDIQVGDVVVAPYDQSRRLRVGKIAGPYYFDAEAPSHRHRRPVQWSVTDMLRDALPVETRNGLKSIQTLSKVLRSPDLYESIANDATRAEPFRSVQLTENSMIPRRQNVWLVSAFEGKNDRAETFVKDGYWALPDGLPAQAESMRVGDRIAIKAAYVRRHDLPFEAKGRSVSTLRIKARGEIVATQDDRVRVAWDPEFETRDWYFYTFRGFVWRLDLDNSHAQQLERFIFEDVPQDFEAFLSDERWAYDDATAAISSPATASSATFRVSRPSADPVYDMAERWRLALVNGRSLFTNEALPYEHAVADLVTYFINKPDEGDGSFLEKLRVQLAAASDEAVLLAAELFYIYCLPLLPSSMRSETKQAQIAEILGWRPSLSPLPDEFIAPLSSGILSGGTGYHTYRWRIMQFLITFVGELTSLPTADRDRVTTNWSDLNATIDRSRVQAAGSMERLVQHLWFPGRAMNGAAIDDRRRISNAYSEVLESNDVNGLVNVLEPNLKYGDRRQVNLYAAPLVFEWRRPNDAQMTWAAWASLVREGLEPKDHRQESKPVTLESLPRAVGALYELQTDAANSLIQWINDNAVNATAVLEQSRLGEPSRAIDDLHIESGFGGDVAEFVEAASTLLQAINYARPVFFRANQGEISEQLSNIDTSVPFGPGEAYQILLEGTATLQRLLLEREGIDLSPTDAADLAQLTLDLNPADTDWPAELAAAFVDWRSGRAVTSPDEIVVYQPITRELKTGEQVVTPPKQTIPETVSDLADSLGFTTRESREWLTLTRDLLLDKRQIILQGPPGTGKTFVAQALSRFLTRDRSRVTLVQFHPATAYEDFVQGLRPKPDTSGHFELRNGPLMEVAERARRDPDHLYVLVIDEINRANLPAVFGELYFLLEYRNEEVTLNYGDRFTLPKNLLLIGTMNTADRSIAAIDAALRRRFMIRDLRPGEPPMLDVLDEWVKDRAPELEWLGRLLDEANKIIGDRDQAVGPSHFLMPTDHLSEQNAQRAWNFTVMPTLRELFYGQPDRVARLEFDALKAAVGIDSTDAETD